jgi:hypothetical protein
VRFSISATSVRGMRRILDGTPAADAVAGGENRFFRFSVSDGQPISCVLTPFSGQPRLSAWFGSVAPPPPGTAVKRDQAADGIEYITMAPTPGAAGRYQQMFLAVTARTTATSSLLVTQAPAAAGSAKVVA